MATVPFDAPENLEGLEDIVDPNEVISDGEILLPSGRKGEAPQYTSLSRVVKKEVRAVKKGQYKGKPFISVTLEFDEFEDESGNKIKLRFPLRAWINTLRWPNGPGRVGVRPSNVDDYLEACGISTKGLSGTEISDALDESTALPVVAHIGWEERVEKDEAGEYPDPRYKTGDFRKGENESFVESFTDDDGNEVRARMVATYFTRV